MARSVTTRILVTDGQERSALAVVRSLGRAGYPVWTCSKRERSLAGASRYAVDAACLEDPLVQPNSYLSSVVDLVDSWEIDVVLPVTDASLLALLGHDERLRPAHLLAPPKESYLRISDKARVTNVAREIGIAVPQQVTVTEPGEIASVEDKIRFPAVVKPSRSVAGDGEGRIRLEVGYVGNWDELQQALETLNHTAFPVLLQQRIEGPGVGVFLLRWNGDIVARFSHRRIREKPPSGGVSVYRESVAPRSGLFDLSSRLLTAHNWRGVAMVEYKVERRTGTPYLMEVNGRFWGSLQLAVDAGVDFPRLLMEAYLGRDPEPVMDYREGVRSRWWWGDIDHLIARLTRSRAALELGDDAPSAAEALLDFLILWRRGDRSEVFRWSDPAPFLEESRTWLVESLRAGND